MPLVTIPGTQQGTNLSTPGTNLRLIWSAPESLQIAAGNVGASQALTTNLIELPNPFLYAWLYDIVVYARSVGTGGATVDVYNAISGGQSYLKQPFVLPASSLPQTVSARATGNYNLANDLTWTQNNSLAQWSQQFVYKLGTLFSVRAATGASGGVTNLTVQVLLIPSNDPTVIG